LIYSAAPSGGIFSSLFLNFRSLFVPTPIYPPLFIYKATLNNSKIRKCFRYQVYKLAEKNFAQIREGDGISYFNDNLIIQLVFKVEIYCMKFQSQIRQLPFNKKRKMTPVDVHIKDEIDYQYEIKKHLEYEMSKIFDTTYQHILKLKKIESNINNYNENQLKNILYSYLYKKYKN
jgi:hypothetical protein